MEFLKAFFGDKAITYDELVQAINAYNGDEKNKEKLIKMVNLTDGGYVSKDKYTNLETDLSGKTKIVGYYQQVWEKELMNIAQAVLAVTALKDHVLDEFKSVYGYRNVICCFIDSGSWW